ncbi:potassium/proton antiporter [Pokkaliibacter sp. CJK22405]|uniref:potassium/proton antiporter n=1 Tax=Pokkaliibacter sp. CJK22405 TaxID=3384615 RepID=UPI0039854076
MATFSLLFIGALLISLSILLSPLSNRIGMPVLLIFLVVGMLAGEDGIGGIQFNDVDMAFLIGNLALAVILLDGGMRTRVRTFRVGLKPALSLATLGVAITAAITGIAAMWVFGLDLLTGLLVGTMVASTDAAAVFSLLQGKGLNINERVAATLEIESGSNDPMAIFLTLLLIQLISSADQAHGMWLEGALLFVKQFGIGVVAGGLGGLLLSTLIRKSTLTLAFYPLLMTAGGLMVFAGTNELGGSGFLAIYLAGVVVGNRRLKVLNDILQVHDGLAWLAQLVLFLMLGMLVTPSNLLIVAPGTLLIALILTFVARPIATWLSLMPFRFRWKEQLFISWVGLRGAVPIVLALFPFMAGINEAYLIFNVAFVVVLFSLILQGSSLAWVARRLGLEVPVSLRPLRTYPLDVAGAGDHELYLYRLEGKRWQVPVYLQEILRIKGVNVTGVFREGSFMQPEPNLTLKERDVVSLVMLPADLEQVSERLSVEQRSEHLQDVGFFGEFVLNGDVTVAELKQAYGVTIPDESPEQTLSDCLKHHCRGQPVVGDKLELETLTLVVKRASGKDVQLVGIKLKN